MKIYKVKVNDKIYEVEVEAVEEKNAHIEASTVKAETSVASEGANIITAPIAGKVLDVKVSIGDFVNKGDTVAVIEAMKLENEIQSAFSGKVKEIVVGKGDDVRNKDTLIILE